MLQSCEAVGVERTIANASDCLFQLRGLALFLSSQNPTEGFKMVLGASLDLHTIDP